MRYRLGILGGLAIAGIISLGLVSGIFGIGTAEAARPSVRVMSHELMVAPAAAEGTCKFALNVGWEGNAYAHKNGHYYLFLWSQDARGFEALVKFERGIVEKGNFSDVILGLQYEGTLGMKYRSEIVFLTSKGKDGTQVGRELVRDGLLTPFGC